jgi:hypothetical protein
MCRIGIRGVGIAAAHDRAGHQGISKQLLVCKGWSWRGAGSDGGDIMVPSAAAVFRWGRRSSCKIVREAGLCLSVVCARVQVL